MTQPSPGDLLIRDDIREVVRQKNGEAALTVLNGEGAACCGGNAGGGSSACCGWRRHYRRTL